MKISIRAATSVACAAAVAVAGALSIPAPAEAGTTTVTAAPKASAIHTVRLVTGDSVTVIDRGGDRRDVVFTPDADSPTGTARITRFGEQITVIPEEAAPLLDSGVLQKALFDIDTLIAEGYADGRDLPLILRHDGDVDLPAGAEVTAELRTLDATAVKVGPKELKGFWAGLRDRGDGATASRLADGVDRVWLDSKVEAALDQSTAQIGAPQAWAAGLDGTGVTVAVLDTGADLNHPDLTGRITEARNFTAEASAADGQGHGTHVASTIAGSGAASGGRYKGVAPGASLLIGKVLDNRGSGTDSEVLAGMEWAARSGADVVNMSLGNSIPTDGTDALSTAVNELTAETGTLFVVAAGNSGPRASTIGSPGAAAGALTVAAVSKTDDLATFSSRGPLAGDGESLKPDIAGPGVGIVAARAAGTSFGTPVNASYTSLSGTSMATPHVAGAAAILAQKHPAWSPAALKGVLMSSAKVLPDGGFAEGSGRVDVPASLDGSVWGTTASFGTIPLGDPGAPLVRTVSFHNTGDQSVTLALDAKLTRDGGAAIPGALTLDAPSITVPAGGSAPVKVTFDPAGTSERGTYTATVTATGTGVTAHATLALSRSPKLYRVTVKATGLDGKPAGASLQLINRTQPGITDIDIDADGTAAALVEAGSYSVMGWMQKGQTSLTAVNEPNIQVTDHDIEVPIDATKAREMTVATPRDGEFRQRTLTLIRSTTATGPSSIMSYQLSRFPGRLYAIPSKTADDGQFALNTAWSIQQRPYEARAHLPEDGLQLTTESATGAGRFDGVRKLRAVDAGTGTQAEIDAADVKGNLALVRRSTEPVGTVVTRLTTAGAAGVMLVNSSDDRWVASVTTTLPVFTIPLTQGTRIADALTRDDIKVTLTGHSAPEYTYELSRAQTDAIATEQAYRPASSSLAAVEMTDYSPAGKPVSGMTAWLPIPTNIGFGATTSVIAQLPNHYTSYFSTEDVVWSRTVLPGWPSPTRFGGLETMRPGERTEQAWMAPVNRPATTTAVERLDIGVPPNRTGDTMRLAVSPRLGSGNGDYEVYGVSSTDKTSLSLYRNGGLLGTTTSTTAVGVTGLPAEAADYRLVLDSERVGYDWWAVSTKVHSEWTFSSAATPETRKLNLLMPDVKVGGVSLESSVRTGTLTPVTVAFRDSSGTEVTLADGSVEVSYDRGTTWTTVRTLRYGDALHGFVTPAKGAESMSLRIRGTDARGATVNQTVIDAVLVD